MKNILLLCGMIMFLFLLPAQTKLPVDKSLPSEYPVAVPVQGNSWLPDKASETSRTINRNMNGWTNKEDVSVHWRKPRHSIETLTKTDKLK